MNPELLELHCVDWTEDATTLFVMWDRADGATLLQRWTLGEPVEPLRRVDDDEVDA